MASSRYSQQPLQIYQDPDDSFDHAPMPSIHNPSNTRKVSPLRPLQNAASRSNIILNPPISGTIKRSPFKSNPQLSSSPLRTPFGNKLNAISMPPPGEPTYNTDSISKKQTLMPKFNKQPHKAIFPINSNGKSADKENYTRPPYQPPQPAYEGFPAGNFSVEGLYAPKPSKKRSLLEAAPIPEPRSFKKPKVVEEPIEKEDLEDQGEIPAPESFAPIHDDGLKPPHLSYAQLIGMAILRAPNRRLTLSQIYKWISDTFSYYKNSETGWQNSIRHNLSLNKAFQKQERPKDDPGKGNYWVIQPGMEHQFIKEKPSKKAAGPNENVPLLSTNLTPVNELDFSRAPFKPLTQPSSSTEELPPQPSQSSQEAHLPTIAEMSSDATIPASDAFALEPEVDEVEELPPSSPLLQSSPPAMMNSSPPDTQHRAKRHNTPPPPVPHFQASSRSRKRKRASMDDSGYFSSLDSSAMRSHQAGRMLTSEVGQPRLKRGRAEEEIARLRGSSYDSPSKGHALSNFGQPSSSPLRREQYSTQMLPPLTPAIKLRAPTKPPPSISPNTNLRLHRERVKDMIGGSPLRGCTNYDELPPWSPEFNLDDAGSLYCGYPEGFDVFTNVPGLFSAPGRSPKFNSKGQPYKKDGSPAKWSAKRPRLDRSRSANILSDITNTNNKSNLDNFMTPIPALDFTHNAGIDIFHSPVKGLGIMESPSKLLKLDTPSKLNSSFNTAVYGFTQEDDFFGAEFLSEEATDFGGMDLMQGFQKIGSGQASRSTPKASSSLPPFARSFTTRL